MATSGTLNGSGGYQGRTLRSSWSLARQDVAGNYSVINWALSAVGGSSSYYYHHKEYNYVNGTCVYSNASSTKRYTGTIASGQRTIYHDSQGKANISLGVSGAVYTTASNVSGSDTWELPDIPRVSDLETDITTVPADEMTEVIATATKKSSSFTDELTVTLGTYSMEITSDVAFTIPEEWINAISGTSAVAKVTVTTKTGDTVIGTKSVDLTVTVPASVVPTISGITVSEAISAVTEAFGNRFVKSLSQLNIQVNAEGIHSSTIKGYKVVLDGVTYIQQAFTSNLINSSGTVNAVVTITDSRGRVATYTEPITIVDYTPPTITSMSYEQCDVDGTANNAGLYTKIKITGTVSSVEGQNTKALLLKYRKMSEEVYIERVITLSDWVFDIETIISDTDPTVTYEYVAILTDKISSTQNKITTGIPGLSLRAGGKGVTFFGEADADGLWVNNGTSKMRLSFTSAELEELSSLLGGGGSPST